MWCKKVMKSPDLFLDQNPRLDFIHAENSVGTYRADPIKNNLNQQADISGFEEI